MQKSNFSKKNWIAQFAIRSDEELDFIIGGTGFLSIGANRNSPAEFRRRLLAAAISYSGGFRSIDYVLKNYVDPNAYEGDKVSLGDQASDYLLNCGKVLKAELKELHTKGELTFGVFGSELTLYKIPDLLDTARMVANRGLLLEVAPILRLGLEMISWASVVFHLDDEEKIKCLQASNCISKLKATYKTVGRVYGYLSKLCHWEQERHSLFIEIGDKNISIIRAKAEHRAISLVLCLIILDILVEVVRQLYSTRANSLIKLVQGRIRRNDMRNAYQIVKKITEPSQAREIELLKEFLC